MNSQQAVRAVLQALTRLRIPFMLTGSLASSFHGRPRATQDADFVVQLGETPIASVLAELGSDFHLDPQMSFETTTGTLCWVIEHAPSAFTIELFLLSDDAHDRERFARRCRVRILDCEAALATPEDVIITKLRWSRQGRRSKDLDDARNVLAVQMPNLDWGYLRDWCSRHGTSELLEELRREVDAS